jgi:tetratricopeptide (TPR) repeat protein
MDSTSLFQQMNKHFFSKQIAMKNSKIDNLVFEEKKLLAEKYLLKGQTALIKGSEKGITHFQQALTIFNDDSEYWNDFALSLYEYGLTIADDKALQFANRCFKNSITLNPDQYDVFFEWGCLLMELGQIREESHFFQRAKEKFQKAIKLSENESRAKRAELYWQYGYCWLKISETSGEAVDIRLSIDSLQKSETLQKDPPHNFWIDKGNAYLNMALLINDNSLFIKATQTFEKAIETDPNSYVAFSHLGNAYTNLYINTMDERHFNGANKAFALSLKIHAEQPEVLLHWAQLMCESGKLNEDPKKLQLSIEKCLDAASFGDFDPEINAQWIESLSYLGLFTNRLDLLLEAEEMIIESVEIAPKSPDLWYAYGVCLIAFGKYYEETEFYEMAIEKLQSGVSLNRTNAEIWQSLAYCHAQIATATEDPGLFERAEKFYRRAIDLKPYCPPLNFEYALCLSSHGELLFNADLLDQALLQFETTIHGQKESLLQHPEWLFHYGTTLDLMGELTEERSYLIRATEILLHILLINPDYPKVYYHLALTFSHLAELISDNNLAERAMNYYHLAAKQDPESSNVFLDWGLCLIHLSHLSVDSTKINHCFLEAEQKLIRAGQLGSQHAYYHLACLYSLLERYQESLVFIQKAHKHGVLPPIEELVSDDWLEGLRHTKGFDDFLLQLESKKQKEAP